MSSDMSATIISKADQVNADDLVGGPITVTVERVAVKQSSDDQPVSIYLAGMDEKKPWKPCKTFRRVLVSVWGSDSKSYVGKSMTLFRNPDVRFGGEAVGGIEISHMTGLTAPKTLNLTATRGKKRTITIQPLTVEPANPLAKLHRQLKGAWMTQIGKSTEGDASVKSAAFCEWVEQTSGGQVLSTDALKPEFYSDAVISELMDALKS